MRTPSRCASLLSAALVSSMVAQAASSLEAQRGNLTALPFARGEMIFTSRNDPSGGVDFCIQIGTAGAPNVLISAKDAPLDAQMPLTDFSVSDDGRLCAYFVTQPDRRYEAIKIIDTKTGKNLEDTILWTHLGDFGWRGNGFYYAGYRKPDSDLSPYGEERVLYHSLGTTQDKDVVVYADQEHAGRKYLFLTTYDNQYFVLHVLERVGDQTLVAEWYRREGDIQGQFQPLQGAMARGRFFLCDNREDHLILFTQYKSPRGRVIDVDTLHPEERNWKTIVPEPVEDAEPVLGRIAAIIRRPEGGTVAMILSPSGKIEGRIPSAPGTKIEVQSCSNREKYAFVSVEKDGAKEYFQYDLGDNRLIPFR
jgi:prolyl oligopeptidase